MLRWLSSYVLIGLIMVFVVGCGEDNDDNVINANESDTTETTPKYRITQNAYLETDNLNQKITDEYGTGYRLADWNDLLADSLEVHEICETLGIENGQEFLVTCNDIPFWNNTNRHYFISRHDHVKPSGYLSHGNIDNHYLDLGSWYNITMRALCVRKSDKI
ncbi:MAG: hypothetical protein JXB48_08510 [Candidatus Latescibacteria bacterium]|nr:hypothetical protein [Candidatus Latescibacterota bacterium]